MVSPLFQEARPMVFIILGVWDLYYWVWHTLQTPSNHRRQRSDSQEMILQIFIKSTDLADKHANFNRSYPVTHTWQRSKCEELKTEKVLKTEIL